MFQDAATFAQPNIQETFVSPTISEQPTLNAGLHRYTWLNDWAKIPQTDSGKVDGRTHGIAVSETGQVIVFHQANPAVLFYDQEGNVVKAWGDRFPGAHGLTLVKEDDTEYLWLADSKTGEVVKMTLAGETVLNLQPPALEIYANGKYAPTWVAVHEERHGGNGDIWVTDGYGTSYIHCYDKQGNYLISINGSEGTAGLFKCPHAIWMDTRKAEAELYIADRGNRRVQVYDSEGNFKRVFGADCLTSPCAFAAAGDLLIIPELRARVAILDRQDRLVGYLGDNEPVCDIKGWPNHPADLIEPGKFNSPHGIAADKMGNLYVVEWIVGGRITKLAPRAI